MNPAVLWLEAGYGEFMDFYAQYHAHLFDLKTQMGKALAWWRL